jgi:CheY-like chemotaxis protein/anti-sigma regulatory factor (Ser/Thr protein kinase)
VPTVLVVDDSSVDRRLVGGLLQADETLTVLYAVDGADALTAMQRALPDLVVTDLRMPKVDGFELVSTVKAKYPAVPTILMTSKGSEEIAVRALQQGAAGYVPKSKLSDRLLENVRTVLSISDRQRHYSRLLRRMTKIEHAVVLDNDLELVGVLVEYLQEGITQMGLCDATDRVRIGIALREALMNALYHGNLEVDSALRESGSQAYHALAEQRAQESPYCDRRIFVDTRLSREGVVLVVRDEGRGFNPRALPDPTDPANLDKLSGRGLVLMRAFMDDVVFNDSGTTVTLSKSHPSDGD